MSAGPTGWPVSTHLKCSDSLSWRQREGIAKAKREGKYKGRAPTALAKAEEAMALLRDGVKPSAAAKQLGIASSSLYRILADQDPTPRAQAPMIAGRYK